MKEGSMSMEDIWVETVHDSERRATKRDDTETLYDTPEEYKTQPESDKRAAAGKKSPKIQKIHSINEGPKQGKKRAA
jgi:hypothetical protein